MAALPPSNTPRFKFHYTVGLYSHTTELRTPVSPTVAGLVMNNVWTALGPLVYTTVLDFVEFAASGSNVFNPVTTTYEGATYGTGVGGVGSVPSYLNFIGRSTGGRRNRIMIFGTKAFGDNFRYSAGEDANIDAALAAFNSSASNIYAIDGLPTVFKTYVNAGVHSHWQKAVR
jgi:hypothetical protein